MDIQSFKKKVLKSGNIRGHGKSITRTKYLTLLNIHKCNFSIDYFTLFPNDIILENNKKSLEDFINSMDYNQNFVHCNHYMIMSKEYYFNYKKKREKGADRVIAPRGGTEHDKYWNEHDKYWNQHDRNDEIDIMLIESENLLNQLNNDFNNI